MNNPMYYVLNAFGYFSRHNQRDGTEICIRNGEVVLPLADREAYGDFLTYMNMLYEEGVIHPDFFTMDNETTLAVAAEGRNGMFCQAPYALVGDDYDQWWGAYPMTSDWNDTARYPNYYGLNCMGAIVTTDCEEVELALAFIDYFYASGGDNPGDAETWEWYDGPREGDGLESLNGMEWTTWHMDESEAVVRDDCGEWETNEEYKINEVWLWYNDAFGNYMNSTFTDNIKKAYSPLITENVDKLADSEDPAMARKEEFANGDYHYKAANYACGLPYAQEGKFPEIVFLTEEEAVRANDLYVAIREYGVSETAKFITGQRPLDELDDYFDTMDELGAQEYVKIFADYYESVK